MSLAAALPCHLARAALTAACRQRPQSCTCAAGGRQRRQRRPSSSGAGGGDPAQPPPPSAAAVAAAAAAAPPLPLSPFSDRRLLSEKLTETARNIVWGDLPQERPREATKAQVAALQERLGYRFKNLYLLRLALVHSSAAPTTHNGILAWVGDAALYLVVAEQVAGALGYVPIGKLSEVRKTLIGRNMCAKYAAHLGLSDHLVLGKSVRVQSAGQPSANMVAEMFEAVMGAVYLDGDLEAVRRCYTTHFPLPADPLQLVMSDGTGSGLTYSSDSNPWE